MSAPVGTGNSSPQPIRTNAKKLSCCEIASWRIFHVTHLTHCCTEHLLYKVQVLCLVGCAEEIRAWCITKILFSYMKSCKKGHCLHSQSKAGYTQQLTAFKEVNCPVMRAWRDLVCHRRLSTLMVQEPLYSETTEDTWGLSILSSSDFSNTKRYFFPLLTITVGLYQIMTTGNKRVK